jgi:hypothetical protein
MQPPDALLRACDWALVATIVVVPAFVLVVTARRPADDRDAFIRKLPPPSQPMAVREAHLRVLVRQEATKHVKVDAVIAVVFDVLGVSMAASDRAPIWVGIAAAASVAVPLIVLYSAFNVLYLVARYRGVQLRLRNDVVWHGSGNQPPAVPNGS